MFLRKKKKGFLIFSSILSLILFSLISVGYFLVTSESLKVMKTGENYIKAQEYANIEAENLYNTPYTSLTNKFLNHEWTKINDFWEYKIKLDNELVNPNTNSKQRSGIVKVRMIDNPSINYEIKTFLSERKTKLNIIQEPFSKVKRKTYTFHGKSGVLLKSDGFVVANEPPFFRIGTKPKSCENGGWPLVISDTIYQEGIKKGSPVFRNGITLAKKGKYVTVKPLGRDCFMIQPPSLRSFDFITLEK